MNKTLAFLFLLSCGGTNVHLIDELAAGVSDAPSGYARVTLRGTSTPAVVYGDYAGTDVLPGPSYNLGEAGSLEAYVGEMVDVYVYTVGGELVRGPTTQVKDAQGLVYSGTAFTGQDPTTGLSGVSRPVAIQTILDLVRSKFGAIDFAVQKDVAATPATWSPASLGVTVGTAFASVKDPTYGAKGDGTANDTTAFQATITAIGNAGGGVVLVPPGTYNVSDALAMSVAGVTIMGIGYPIIQSTVNNKNIFTGTAAKLAFKGVRLRVAVSTGANSTGYGISLSSADDCLIDDVRIEESTSGTYLFADGIRISGSLRCVISNCRYLYATTNGVYLKSTSRYSKVLNNYFAGGSLRIDDSTFSLFSGNSFFAGSPVYLVASLYITATGNYTEGVWHVDVDSSIIESGNTDGGTDSFTTDQNSLNTVNRWTSPPKYGGVGVVSSGAMTVPHAGMHKMYSYAGTANITSIVPTGFNIGDEITIFFSNTASATGVTDGSNLSIAGNFVYTPNDSITLKVDTSGSTWFEVSRSVN